MGDFFTLFIWDLQEQVGQRSEMTHLILPGENGMD